MSKPKDPCKICPFIRDCVAEGEDKRWCFVRILTLEAWERSKELRCEKNGGGADYKPKHSAVPPTKKYPPCPPRPGNAGERRREE